MRRHPENLKKRILRRLPVGAEPQPGGGVHFRVWAPRRERVELVPEPERPGDPVPDPLELAAQEGGYFAGLHPELSPGSRYRFRLDGGGPVFPDPASRFQPEGPHGASQVIEPGAFRWSDPQWRGIPPDRHIVYEMHVGTFTEKGKWSSALEQLPALAELGITTIELLPVADFAGRFGWGYDGVNFYAPTRLYGQPDDFRRFVDCAHGLGLAVILDVVYNHFGPDGNYTGEFSDGYVSPRYRTDWGAAYNFDGPDSEPVREFVVGNAGYWIDEYHLDGLRLDATQNIYDASEEHIIKAIVRRVREAARGRTTYVVAENEPQQTRLARPPGQGGFGIDALWNDDFHHSATVAMTGRNEAYYTDYLGQPQELVSLAKHGYLFQGQRYQWQQQSRGSPTRGLPYRAFLNCLDNHDQIANSGRGLRCHMLTSPGRFRALSALLLLSPGTPLLFQGQEYAASTPFYYFADHREDLGRLVCEGRAQFLAQFRSLALPEMQAYLPDPGDPGTFVRSKLAPQEREAHGEVYRLYRDLIALRRGDRVFSAPEALRVDGAVLGPESLVLRYSGGDDERLLLLNLGRDQTLQPAPEPLLAPPEGFRWAILWSSEHPEYGGRGTALWDPQERWWLPGHTTVVLAPVSRSESGEEGRHG